MKINKKDNRGFTIIETMVAISLFLVVVMFGMGALLNANLLHKKSADMRSIMDNLSFIMEDMSRNMRTGYNYRCINNNSDLSSANIETPLSGATCLGIAFESATGNSGGISNPSDQWVYYINNTDNKVYKSTLGPYDSSPNNFIQLTPDEIVMDTSVYGFSVLGAEPPVGSGSNRQQPFITIRLAGKINLKNTFTSFSLETSVSQRLIDVNSL